MLALIVGDAPTDRYVLELLEHAGIPFRQISPSQVHPGQTPLCLLAGRKGLTAEERAHLRWFVEQGGCLVAVGAVNGLEALLGVHSKGRLREGWLKFARSHPIGNGLQSSLHVFGGVRAHAQEGTQVIAHIVNRDGEIVGDAVTVRLIGDGLALFLAPDLCFSVVHIQQGISVVKDGQPAPDGSAPINDGILKAEDGLVLDWERDRIAITHPQGSQQQWVFFGRPIADELRALLLQTLFYAAWHKNLPLPLLWYWADGAPAVGLISHDTDGNDPTLGAELLATVQRLGIVSTWCVLYPGGYPPSLYHSILEAGCEIALHFDAFTGTPLTTWSKRNFQVQWQWLKDATGVAAVSNKNHYTRWQGRLEFFRWCEELGIVAEQSKGPSKKGTVGFLFGGSHPWRPLDDERERPRFLKVLAINLFSQDMVSGDASPLFHPAIVPVQVGEELLRETVRVGGVAHFLFHPAHIRRPGTKAALERLVAFGQELGVQWWTSAQIADWLNRRRSVRQRVQRVGNQWLWHLSAPQPLEKACLLHPLPPEFANRPSVRQVYGFPFAERITTLSGTNEFRLPWW